jgi:hypothetical protein
MTTNEHSEMEPKRSFLDKILNTIEKRETSCQILRFCS